MKQAILAVSFGTSYSESREKHIGAIERAMERAFPEYDVYRAFTSQIILDKLKKRDGIEIDNVTMALERAVAGQVRKIIVQPTHLMDGFEYMKLVNILKGYVHQFEEMRLGTPLLTDDRDFDTVIRSMTEATAAFDDGETAICWMGHGTEALSNAVYTRLQSRLRAAGYEHHYIGTVEEGPLVDELLHAVNEKGIYHRIILEPLMVVAGDHANHDMAGDDAHSWKKRFEAEGYEVVCLMRGLGELTGIQNLYIEHVRNSVLL